MKSYNENKVLEFIQYLDESDSSSELAHQRKFSYCLTAYIGITL